jgi:hypothetical protein
MENNGINFQHIIKEKMVRKSFNPLDLLYFGAEDKSYAGGYAPAAMQPADFKNALGITQINNAVVLLANQLSALQIAQPTNVRTLFNSAAITAMGSTTLILLAGGGVGAYPQIETLRIEYNKGTIAYINGNAFELRMGSTVIGTIDKNFITAVTDKYIIFDIKNAIGATGVSKVPNEALTLGIVGNVNPTTGDGTFIMEIDYFPRVHGII